jgi:ATP adenylyltransferase
MAWIEEGPAGRPQGCFLCTAVERRDPCLLWYDDDVQVILNRFPYNPGHLMVAPRAHRADWDTLPDALAAALDATGRAAVRAQRAVMSPDGFNVGSNLGVAAGAGVPGHLHLHVVPRWAGDVNFMPVLAETRVIPEHLDRSAAKLRPALAKELGVCDF